MYVESVYDDRHTTPLAPILLHILDEVGGSLQVVSFSSNNINSYHGASSFACYSVAHRSRQERQEFTRAHHQTLVSERAACPRRTIQRSRRPSYLVGDNLAMLTPVTERLISRFAIRGAQ
jgi:hypothetical protein